MWATRPPALRAALAITALLASVAPARALDLSLQLQPGYAGSSGTVTDETGHETRTDSSIWLQRYRLNLEAPIYPQLVLSAGGLLDWSKGSSSTEGVGSDFDSKRWSGFGHLRLGGGILTGGLDYDRRDETAETRSGGITSSAPRLVSETYGASIGWRPADLPSLDLQLHRLNGYDWSRKVIDRTSDDALIATRFKPAQQLNLGLSLRAARSEDRLTGVNSRDLGESVQATYSDTFLSSRASVYASYNGAATQSTISLSKTGGTVSQVQVPVAGLSIVEVFPALPTQVTLNPNAALVNGDVTASAGINLGFSGSAGGQRPYRDMGAQFPNSITPVNEIYVWVDRQLPADVAAGFAWEAYRSDDNVTWTRVAITGAVQFGLLQNRFEIPIERTEATYVKIVTRPIPTTLTVDTQFSEIFVTEAQFLLVRPAEEVRGRNSSLSGTVTASGKLTLVPSIGLAYDVSASLTHSDSAQVTWATTNGLSAARRLSPVFGLSGRVERSDSDSGRGHESTNRWGTSLSIDPLPTLGGAVTYNGLLSQRRAGNALSQGVGAFARADVYEGIALNASVTHSRGFNETDQSTQGTTVAAGATLVPNRLLTINGSVSHSQSSQTGGNSPDRSDERTALDASGTFIPVPALAISGGVSRFYSKGTAPQTLVNFSGSLSPFPGGDLQLRYGYQETLDTGSDLRTRTHGPGLRWNIRPSWFFDAGYIFQDSWAPASSSSTRVLSATLTITLR